MQHSLLILRDGADRHNAFCEALFSFRIGKAIIAAAEFVVARDSEDLIGDTHLADAARFQQSEAVKAMNGTTSLSASAALHVGVGDCCGKLLGAFNRWSKIRCEEMFVEACDIMHAMECACMHSGAVVWHNIVRVIGDTKLAHGTEGDKASANATAGDPQAFASFASFMKDLGELTAVVEQSSEHLAALVKDLNTDNKIEPGEFNSWASTTTEAMTSTQSVLADAVEFAVAMHALFGPWGERASLPKAKSVDEVWTAFLHSYLVAGIAIKHDMVCPPSEMCMATLALRFCKARASLLAKDEAAEMVSMASFEAVLDACLADADKDSLLQMFSSEVAQQCMDTVALPVLDQYLSAIVKEFRVVDARGMDLMALSDAPVSSLLPRLVVGDLAPVVAYGLAHIRLVDSLGELGDGGMPHMKTCAMLQAMVKLVWPTSGGRHCVSMQVSSEGAQGLIGDSVSLLLSVHEKIYTVIVLAALADKLLLSASPGEVWSVPSGAPQGTGAAKQEGSVQSVLRPGVIRIVALLSQSDEVP